MIRLRFSFSFCVSSSLPLVRPSTVEGRVYKVVQWFDETSQQSKSELLDIFEVTTPEPIRMMEISPKVITRPARLLGTVH